MDSLQREPRAGSPFHGETQEVQQGEESKAKPEKTPEQREIERLRRGIDRKTRQLAKRGHKCDCQSSGRSIQRRRR